jgi:hypothetical protein
MSAPRHMTVTPSAARLTSSLRDIGYDFPSAVADIVDNSIAAGAERIAVEIRFDGADSYALVADDGCGMNAGSLFEALRFGSRRRYVSGDFGRYGLGLKTASLSQCRTLTVVSRRAGGVRTFARQLDLDLIEKWDEWIVCVPQKDPIVGRAKDLMARGFNTVVAWEKLDRVLPEKRPDGGGARRRIEAAADKTGRHLAMVFHRFLEADTSSGRIEISLNDRAVEPWNPFAPDEPGTTVMPTLRFELPVGDTTGEVTLRRFVLPPRNAFSSAERWDRLSGPLKWNRQQGLYIYRADRLVQWGGWAGIRAIDEHTKLARVALDFGTDLDTVFNINVAKMRVILPAELKQMLEQPLHEACLAAGEAYRRTSQTRGNLASHQGSAPAVGAKGTSNAGLALRSAALQSGEYEAFKRIVKILADEMPEAVEALGLKGL